MSHVFSIRTMWRSFFCALMATFTLAVRSRSFPSTRFDTSVRPLTHSAPGSLSFSRLLTIEIGTFSRLFFSSSLEYLGYEFLSFLKNKPNVDLKGFVWRLRGQFQSSSRCIPSKAFNKSCSSRSRDSRNHNRHDRLLQSFS